MADDNVDPRLGSDRAADRLPHADGEEIEALSDDELEMELKIASHDRGRRTRRYERLVTELLLRRRGYRRRQPALTN
jgi:hypothetical protein